MHFREERMDKNKTKNSLEKCARLGITNMKTKLDLEKKIETNLNINSYCLNVLYLRLVLIFRKYFI